MTKQHYGQAAQVMRLAGIIPFSVRRGRLFLSLMMMALSTATAWAADVHLTENTGAAAGTAARWYVNMPKTGSNTLTLANASITTFKVYDDGGAAGNYSDECDGTLTITAPAGCVLQLSGNITAENCCDYLYVYNGTDNSGTPLLERVSSTSSGTTTAIPTVVSSGQSMTLYFWSDDSGSYDGLDLTVTLIDPNTAYAISGLGSSTGGNIAASVDGKNATTAKVNEVVTLTATPNSNYLLNDLIVTDANGNPVSVDWIVLTNTATFRMPASAVTVTPTFTNVNSLFVNMPKTGSKSATIPTGIQSFKVYDDGGATDNYSDGCAGTLTLTAPVGYVLQLSGNITTQWVADCLAVYDGSTTGGTPLLERVSSTSSGTTTAIPTVVSSGQSMTLYFYSDGSGSYDGLDLTVTLINASTQYAINGLSSSTGGTIVASVGGTSATTAKVNEVVTLTANPQSNYLLNDLIVIDANGNPVSVDWSVLTNTATFRMPPSPVTVTPTFTNVNSLFVNMPKSGSKSTTIPTGIQSFKVYDDGGAAGNYSDGCDGTLTLTAPAGYVLQLSGNITTGGYSDYLYVYDGTDNSGTPLLEGVKSTSDGTTTAITTVNSTGQSMTLYFHSDVSSNYAGLDLTVTLISTSTAYAINGLSSSTCGTIVASVSGKSATTAKINDEVTLTATPGSGYLLSSISVTDANGKPVAVTWDGSFDNTATFRMPLSAVTVSSTFTNTWTADGGLCVNMPTTGSTTVTIPTGVQSFKVYDDGGATGNYSGNCDGTLTLTAPSDYALQLSGNITAERNCDYLTVYDGTDDSGTPLLERVSSTSSGITTGITTVVSSGQSMTLRFYSDSSKNYDGLDLTVTLIDPNTAYAINILGSGTGGTIAASVDGKNATTAKVNDVVTLTATPNSNNLLSDLIVTDADGNAVSVEWSVWTNTATFRMPASAATVTPTFTNVNSHFVNMPKTGSTTVTIPTGVQSFKVYDDGGAAGNYSDDCDGTLVLTAPAGYVLQLSGNITLDRWWDYLTVYDGTDNSGTPLLNQAHSTGYGDQTGITPVVSTGQSMTLYFHSNSSNNFAGLDLTVTLINASTQYAINGLSSSTGGTIVASVGGTSATTAKVNEVVTLTATPGSGYLLSNLSVTDADGNAVSMEWSVWTNTATFRMPASAVTVTPTFTNTWTAGGGLFVNMPTTGSKSSTIPTGVQSFKVYDDGGAAGNYSDDCDGTLTLTAPAGYVLQLSGNIAAESCCDKLTVYDGTDNSGTPLLERVSSTSDGITTGITPVVSTGQSMTLYFRSDVSSSYAGLDLTVRVGNPTAAYAISGLGSRLGGTVTASVGGKNATTAKVNEVVTLTATPAIGYVVSDISVTDADGNAVSVEWDNTTNTATFRMPLSAVTVTPTFSSIYFVDNGDDTYTILNAEGWDVFCDRLDDFVHTDDNGYCFDGKTVKLDKDITITRAAGNTGYHDFTGIFDGQGHTLNVNITDTENQGTAPFRVISNATIRNLHVTGNVTGTAHCAGLVGYASSGTMLIENCLVETNVTSLVANASGNKHCGGVVGHGFGNAQNPNSVSLTLRNVIYAGTITCDQNYIGGLQGWSDGNTLTLENCLFAGSYAGKDGNTALFHPIALRYTNKATNLTATNVFTAVTPTVTDTKYIACSGAKVTGRTTAPASLGNEVATYDYMNATVYEHGLLYNGLYYVAPTFSTDDSGAYLLSNMDDWTNFCDALYDNDTWDRFSGKTVKLTASIGTTESPVTRAAGSSYHDFCGTFDGQGYTLTVDINSDDSHGYTAPFSYISETTPTGGSEVSHTAIRNLNVAGTVTATKENAGGIVGCIWGTLTIEHCTSNVHITAPGNAGGFVGLCEHTVMFTDCVSSAVITSPGGNNSGFVGWSRSSRYTISFEGCVFNGKLLQQNGEGRDNGGFIGWKGDAKTVTITNCLFAPAALAAGETMASGNSATFSREHANYAATITNSYYTQPLDEAQGKEACTAPASPVGDATQTYTVSGITAYANGITRTIGDDVTFYYGDGDNVIVTGDANGDGQVTLADAVAVVNYILGKPSVNFNIVAADMNGDGNITITDAVSIVNMLQKQ